MAASDKTYTDSYKDYKEFKDWADKQFITFFDGYKVCVGDWVWNKVEKDFTYGEIPIMNTSWMIDLYLVQNCPFKFVIDRLDCSKGYSKNNVVLTSYAANCGRADCPVENWKLIIKNIKNGLNTKS